MVCPLHGDARMPSAAPTEVSATLRATPEGQSTGPKATRAQPKAEWIQNLSPPRESNGLSKYSVLEEKREGWEERDDGEHTG